MSFIVDQFTAFLLAYEGWGGLRRYVVFFIESETHLHGILGAANIPRFDARFYAPLLYSVMDDLMGAPPTCSRKIKIAVLDQSACPFYPVSNL